MNIDNPFNNDNRNYSYTKIHDNYRPEYPIIVDWIPENVKVIDFGCGEGSLLKLLIDLKNVEAIGIDIAETGIVQCGKKNIKARVDKIDKFHDYLKDKEFDYAICNATVQMVMYPEILIQEMIRVSKYQIISFPNFAYFKNRFELFFKGIMPKTVLFGYSWYNTGHIHQCSIKDFIKLIYKFKLKIVKVYYVGQPKNKYKKNVFNHFSNLLAPIAVFMTETL